MCVYNKNEWGSRWNSSHGSRAAPVSPDRPPFPGSVLQGRSWRGAGGTPSRGSRATPVSPDRPHALSVCRSPLQGRSWGSPSTMGSSTTCRWGRGRRWWPSTPWTWLRRWGTGSSCRCGASSGCGHPQGGLGPERQRVVGFTVTGRREAPTPGSALPGPAGG